MKYFVCSVPGQLPSEGKDTFVELKLHHAAETDLIYLLPRILLASLNHAIKVLLCWVLQQVEHVCQPQV